MEEQTTDENCSIVYFSTSAQDDIHKLYCKASPPEAPPRASGPQHSLDQVYQNVRTLLDEYQGGFEEVLITSHPDRCSERLEAFAGSAPTIVLIEMRNRPNETKSKTGSLSFLRSLRNDIESARFQKHVMPFTILVVEDSSDRDIVPDPTLTATCLQAGAIDILRSPLRHEDLNRIIGHVRENLRPPAHLIGAHMAQNLVDSIHRTGVPAKLSSHRPDEALSSERKAVIEKALQRWHFPAQEFNADELTYAILFILEHILRIPDLEAYSIPRHELVTFLLATRRQYKHEREVHYHNWRHAVDVTQSIFCFLLDLGIIPPVEKDSREQKERAPVERVLTSLDGLILLVSAIGHDVGHPGVNNAFLVACNHPLAQTYNDKSVLENYHCAAYSQLLRRHWPSLNNIAGFRATMIITILATDMQRHFEFMSNLNDLKAKVDSSDTSVDDWAHKDRDQARELIMAILIKAADISNVARPFDVSARWAKILMKEFARQGELESELQIPTCLFGGPPNTEDVLAAANSQKGFMNLFGFPLFQGIAGLMPSMSNAVRELENNKNVWDERIEDEKRRREPGSADPPPTLRSVDEDEVKEAERDHRTSEPGAVPLQPSQTPSTPTKRGGAATGVETSPSRHAAHALRQHMAQGIALDGHARSSAPQLESPRSALFSPSSGSGSKRSSKDIALDQMHQFAATTNLESNPGSRRGSADASWQVHQSYPSSRRGSKDEQLTTILVTSGGAQNRRASPPSGQKSSPGQPQTKRQSVSRASIPSSKAQTASSLTATSMQYSPSTEDSTQPSSPDGELTPPAALASIPTTEDPFMHPEVWPDQPDHHHRASVHGGLPDTLASTAPPALATSKSESSQSTAGDTKDSRPSPRKGESGIRESRSRSRLRGLKFWKKRKDTTGSDASATEPASGSP